MVTIKIVLASILFSFYFIEQARIPAKFKIDYKPFNCIICLPFYISTILYFTPFQIVNYILVVSTSCVFAPFVKNLLYNISQNTILKS